MAVNAENKPDSILWVILALLVALLLMTYLTAAASSYQSCLFEAQLVGGDDKFADDCSRWNPLPF